MLLPSSTDLEILRGFEILELKELLSNQILFNIGLNLVSFEGKDLSPPKALGLKALQKRKEDTIDSPTLEGSHGTPVLLSKVILSLPALDIFDFFSEEGPTMRTGASKTIMGGVQFIDAIGTPRNMLVDMSKAALGDAWVFKVAGTFGTMPVGVELHVSTLNDYDLACKAFSNFLYFGDASKLLVEPLKMKWRKALDCFIRLAHYLNGFMEDTTDLSTKASRFELEASMLKTVKDKLSKMIREASNRADAVEKKA
ncbi:putative ankycorbin-like [Cocos nucifera]|nr:putative ankycorbin-like [Cocos nucifera]